MTDYIGKLRWVTRATDKVLQQWDGAAWADVPLYVEAKPATGKASGTVQAQGTIAIKAPAWTNLFQKDMAQ